MLAIDIANEFLRRFAAKETPDQIAELFSEDVDWYVAGDLTSVPWIGRKVGRVGVSDFWRQIQVRLANKHFTVSDIFTRGERVVIMGDLESELRSTGKLIVTDYVFDLDVADDQITRFRMLEDTHAVAQAFILPVADHDRISN